MSILHTLMLSCRVISCRVENRTEVDLFNFPVDEGDDKAHKDDDANDDHHADANTRHNFVVFSNLKLFGAQPWSPVSML